jgi:NADPH2:quinone reductase
VADAGTAVIAVMAAGINPSDVKNVAGRFDRTTLPRTPGRDYSGVVVDGPGEWKGALVWGSGGDVGFTRDGTHAELLAVPVASLCRKPPTLSHEQAAAMGVSFVTAWCGVVEYGALRAGETLVVTGGRGCVGGAAVQLGARIGARVIAVERSPPPPGVSPGFAAERVFAGDGDVASAVRALTGGRGADMVFDTVGGPLFDASLAMLAPRGRLCVIASVGQPRVMFHLVDFYHNESQLFGVDSLARDLVASGRVLGAVGPGFEDGSLRALPVHSAVPLAEATGAYRRVLEGVQGRILLLPSKA